MSKFLLFIEKRYNWILGLLIVCMMTSTVLFCFSIISLTATSILFCLFAIIMKMTEHYNDKARTAHVEELKKVLRNSLLDYLHKRGYEYFYADENADSIEREIADMVQADGEKNHLKDGIVDITRRIPSQTYDNQHISIDIVDQKVEYKISARFQSDNARFSFVISSDKISIETD